MKKILSTLKVICLLSMFPVYGFGNWGCEEVVIYDDKEIKTVPSYDLTHLTLDANTLFKKFDIQCSLKQQKDGLDIIMQSPYDFFSTMTFVLEEFDKLYVQCKASEQPNSKVFKKFLFCKIMKDAIELSNNNDKSTISNNNNKSDTTNLPSTVYKLKKGINPKEFSFKSDKSDNQYKMIFSFSFLPEKK